MPGEEVLVVDDNAINLKLLRVLLTCEGYSVRTAVDAEEALETLETFRPRLVLTDLQLPGMDGLELTRRIKADPRLRGVVVIAVTAYAMKGDEEKARGAGCDGYLTKPIDTAALPATLNAYLDAGGLMTRILIVDDLDLNRKVLRVLLQSEGMETVEACDGAEGLRALSGDLPDAIISDILMPNMDGYRFCQAVRRDARTEKIPIIIYTSTYVSHGEGDLALLCGADRYLTKPAPSELILSTLAELLSLGRSDRAAAIPLPDEDESLQQYSQVLIRKLEKRNVELQELTTRLTESEEKIRQLVENINQVYFLLTVDGAAAIYVSPAYERIWGQSCESVLAAPDSWLDAVTVDDRPSLDELLRTRRSDFEAEFRIDNPALGPRWIRMRSFPVLGADGRMIRLGRVAEDITLFKQTEAHLRQAQKIDGIGQLAGGIAHDFNNILTAILGYSHFLHADLPPNDPMRADVEEIQRAGERAAALTRQLLAFSRQQVLQPKVVDLNLLVGDLEKMLRRLIGEDMQLISDLRSERGRIRADPGQIEQVILNLVVNARDALPRGGKITIATGDAEPLDGKSGGHVLLSVTDDGSGMDADVLCHLFEPFFTTKQPGKGTGLGLSTVHGIVKQSGGSITVDSKRGEGTTFTIRLPRCLEEYEKRPLVSPSSRPARGTETILLVEDDDTVRGFVRRLLLQNGYHLLEASDAAQALSLSDAHTTPIHLLLTDIVMPGMRGDDLARALSTARPEMRVIFTSGYTQSGIVRQALQGDDVVFLVKPVDPDLLVREVRRILDRRPLEAMPGA